MRFNAIDMSDNRIADEYGIITECAMYHAFYKDDFKWNKVRAALREDIHNHIALFPTGYGYRHQINLDRYDFRQKIFLISEDTPIHNVNAFLIFKTSDEPCGPEARIRNIPDSFRAILDAPIYVEGIPMAPEDAAALIKRMKAADNETRTVYAKFNLQISYIEPLHPFYTPNPTDTAFVQGTHLGGDPMQLNAHLDSIDFYEDKDMTQLIYEYKL